MLQPTIYIPSRLTRMLATPRPAPQAGARQEPCWIGRIELARISGSLCAIRAVA